ncbi:acyltransferase [Flavisolibacter ginsenosidimutans]|nr:acyltransferase [Flavisolibacter ginsenosidimutans]
MNVVRKGFFWMGVWRRTAAYYTWQFLTKHVWFLRVFYETGKTEAYVTFKIWFFQKVLGFNRRVYWPVHYRSTVNLFENIVIGVGSAPGLSPGCYIQGRGRVIIGNYVGIGPNVGIISGGHQLFDFRVPTKGYIKIGNYSWIGMNSVILENVELGDFTIVQAGSVVKKSFKQGYCVIGGNPAVLIKEFPPESHHLFERYKNEYEYIGYMRAHKFAEYRKRYLWF